MSKPVYSTTKCMVCKKPHNNGVFCSRACALEQQRRVWGYTLAELRGNRALKVKRDWERAA
jgi:predicted nucleic acid-binding Zn ribbon protein